MEQWGKVAHLGLGSNQNSPRAMPQRSGGCSDGRDQVVQCSPFYRTEPVGTLGGDWFINAVVEIRTVLPARPPCRSADLERAMGASDRGKGAVIDLDILPFNQDIIFDEDRLIVPHPELQTPVCPRSDERYRLRDSPHSAFP